MTDKEQDDIEQKEDDLISEERVDINTENGENEVLRAQILDLQDKVLRVMAESENTKRRYEKQIDEVREYAITNFAKDLLGVADNLSRAIKYMPLNLEGEVKSMFGGIEMTQKELHDVLLRYGIEPIEPMKGTIFDPNNHEAVLKIPADADNLAGTVGEMVQIGYRLKNRLLRPASVTVFSSM